MSLKDLIADVNVNEICEHIETETLSEWVNAWQEVAISALRPISRERVEKVWRGKWIHAMPILGSGDEEIRCSKCGNIIGFETDFCPYCGNPTVVPGQFSGQLKPDFIIPFKLSKEDAVKGPQVPLQREVFPAEKLYR